MNFGTQNIQDIIYQQLKRAAYKGGIPFGKFAKDTAKLIFELMESEPMNQDMRTEALVRGISQADIQTYDKICKAFGFPVMQLTPSAFEVYRWVEEQEAKGQKLSTFVKWAQGTDRIQYIRMYRKDPSNIKLDWPRAFFSPAINKNNTREVERL